MDIVKDYALHSGVPSLRRVPCPADTALTRLPAEYIPKFIEALTKPLTEEEKKSGIYNPPIPPRIAMTGTLDEVQSYFEGDLVAHRNGGPWGRMNDGLPIIPPTEERVARMLRGTSHSPDEVIRFGVNLGFEHGRTGRYLATIEQIAVNAVMAGCKPEYMPVVLAIAETGACIGGASDSSMGNMYVVSGPIAKDIGMNSGVDFLESGNPANMALERVAQLMGLNLGHRTNGISNIERTGNIYWGTTFAENPYTPWDTLNVHYGYDADESVLLFWSGKVTLVPFQNIEVKSTTTLEENQVGTPAHALAALKTLTNLRGAILNFTPDTAWLWAEKYPDIAGTMESLQNYIWDNVTWRAGDLYQNYWFVTHHEDLKILPRERGTKQLNPDHLELPDDAQVPMFDSPDDITVIVAGGTGPAWTWGGCFRKPQVLSIDKWR